MKRVLTWFKELWIKNQLICKINVKLSYAGIFILFIQRNFKNIKKTPTHKNCWSEEYIHVTCITVLTSSIVKLGVGNFSIATSCINYMYISYNYKMCLCYRFCKPLYSCCSIRMLSSHPTKEIRGPEAAPSPLEGALLSPSTQP